MAGTVHNELLAGPEGGLGLPPPDTATGRPGRGGVAQYEGIDVGPALAGTERVTVRTHGAVRRTHIRRTPVEIAQAGLRVGEEAAELLAAGLAPYPTPAAHCLHCPYAAPCAALGRGLDPTLELATHFRRRPDAR